MSILVVDVGNSRTKYAVCHCGDGPLPEMRSFFACDNEAADVLATRLAASGGTECMAAVLAGSNAPLRDELNRHWPADLPSPVVLSGWQQVGVPTDVESVGSVGIDRLLNAAGVILWRPNGPTIVVDSGTATTVDLVDDGVFRGGAILPGLRLAAQSLHDYTAALPLVDTYQLTIDGTVMPGRNTQQAIEAGILIGQVGAIRELIQSCTSVVQGNPTLVLTGGAADRLGAAFPQAETIPHLTLRAMAALTPA